MWLTTPCVLPHLPLQGGSTVMPTGAVVMPPSYMPGACPARTQGQKGMCSEAWTGGTGLGVPD